jgi:mycothiol synthase
MRAPHTSTRLRVRAYAGDADYWRIRDFLREVLVAGDLRPTSWPPARWDYWRWHGIYNVEPQVLEEVVYLWLDADGQLIAVANPEGAGNLFFQIHPDHRDPELVSEMLGVGEERMAALDGGMRRLEAWIPESQPQWGAVAAAGGYEPGPSVEHDRAVHLDGTLPDAPVAHGYVVRSQLESDRAARGIASWRVFHPTPDGTTPMSADGYRWIERCPLYRRDLDLLAVAEDGAVAGFCTIWFDDATRTAMVEPMGVLPEHRQRGLARALLVEGLRRVAWLGATVAHVGSYAEPAHSLYASVGMETVERFVPWARQWSVEGDGPA